MGVTSILISGSYRRKFLIQRRAEAAQSKIGEKRESGARGSEPRIQTWGDTEGQSVCLVLTARSQLKGSLGRQTQGHRATQ